VRHYLASGGAILACAALGAGCGGNDDESSETQTTPPGVLNAVFERAFSECGSQSVQQLAGKYRVDANSTAVSTAVGKGWAERFGGYPDAQREGKLACLQSLALEAPPGQSKKKSKKKQAPPTATVQP
jgi:hypothetical protein